MKYLRSTPFEVKINILTLTQYCELVSSASAFLGGDTGPTHMAIALDIPTVCILGGGHFNRYFPYPKITQSQIKKIEYVYIQKECYNCEWLCTDKNLFSCIKDIDTNMIKNAFSLLGIC